MNLEDDPVFHVFIRVDGVRNRLKLKDKPDERCDVQQHKHVSVWFDCVVGGETLVTFHLHSKPLTHTQKHEP